MNFLNRIFRSNMVPCPRCLGKGEVDAADIARLKKELFWGTGKCAYCNGTGKVPSDRSEKVDVDFDYLTTDLSATERYKMVNGNNDALNRGRKYKEQVEKIIEEVVQLYYVSNMEPEEITDYLFQKQLRRAYSEAERQETIAWIKKIIKSKLKK